jgi:translation initiation factor 2 subunit 2
MPEAEADLSWQTLKKKKKKPKAATDDFAKKLEALNLEGQGEDKGAEAAEAGETGGQDGDMNTGTGVWQHDESVPVEYSLLLNRFFSQLAQKNPDHASSASKSYKIPPPQCLREGNKKTIFANIAEICKRMKRTDEHVTQYLFAELGTTGSVDGNRRLVIKGKFKQKDIENVVRKYIMEYVTCRTCRSPDTMLEKGENRLLFITCNHCKLYWSSCPCPRWTHC